MRSMLFYGLLVLCLVWVGLRTDACGAVVGSKDSMRNLDGVRVEVDIEDFLLKDGLNQKQIRSEVIDALKRADIRLLSESEWRAIKGRPLILIQVTGQKIQENWKFYTYAINIRLIQDVMMLRDQQTEPLSASTWFYQMAGHGYIDDIRVRILEATQIFTDAFHSANPR